MVRIAYGEADEIAHVVIQRDTSALDLLHECSGCERLGDRCYTHHVVVGQRCLGLKVLVAKRLVVDDLSVLNDGSRDADDLKLVDNSLNGLVGLTLLLSGKAHESERQD